METYKTGDQVYQLDSPEKIYTVKSVSEDGKTIICSLPSGSGEILLSIEEVQPYSFSSEYISSYDFPEGQIEILKEVVSSRKEKGQ